MTGLSTPDVAVEQAYKNVPRQPQHPLAYPSPPHSVDGNSRLLGHKDPYRRRPSSAFSESTTAGSPAASRSTAGFDGHRSPPTSPATTSTSLGSDSRQCSTGPSISTPTFEKIYSVPRVELAPKETERKSILERFPTSIFMRIMMHVDYKQQIQLRRCNSNMFYMVNLDAIPWEIKTAVLLNEENFTSKFFPKKPSRSQGVHGSVDQDSDGASSSDEERSLSSKGSKGKGKCVKAAPNPKSQTKGEHMPGKDTDWFACYSCYKILPAYYFEGRNLEIKTGRAGGGQKRRGYNHQAEKKVDTRVEYVRVVSINPGRQPPEWLVEDQTNKFTATTVASYVAAYMNKGVNCDDLRLYYKDITLDTHCIKPVRGVKPFFTASPSATPPGCEMYRPVYHLQENNLLGHGATGGVDNDVYTYEICIPPRSQRDEDALERPRSEPCTRICQPQGGQRTTTTLAPDAAPGLVGLSTPARQVGEFIALRRFCIPCGARYGAYTRDCNRKIVSKCHEKGWWVCDCPKVREAGVGRSCPDCGRTVMY
jgi:hypothetical protein